MNAPRPMQRFLTALKSIGPAVIIASVVLGPGSILANSKVGCQYGHELLWVLVGSCVLLFGMTALSARLGVALDGTLCDELANRAGRPIAAAAGITLFLIAACFQFGNNLGVLFAIEPLMKSMGEFNAKIVSVTILIAINGGIILALLRLRKLYRPVETLMKILVAVMLFGFAANLFMAAPSLWEILAGLKPQLPDEALQTLLPQRALVAGESKPQVIDNLWAVQALIGTTFSVGGAFYHSYLVRQKGWTSGDLKQGLVDSAVGIAILTLMSMMIMITAAKVLHGKVDVDSLESPADIASQLQPLFGNFATGLFCLGIFAGAFSSFLVNAMIGGTVLSDGLGQGGSIDDRWPRIYTVVGLLTGMLVAIAVKAIGMSVSSLIIFAQALTVLGNPLLAGAMLYLATRKDMTGQRKIPLWLKLIAAVGFVVALFFSLRTGVKICLMLFPG